MPPVFKQALVGHAQHHALLRAHSLPRAGDDLDIVRLHAVAVDGGQDLRGAEPDAFLIRHRRAVRVQGIDKRRVQCSVHAETAVDADIAQLDAVAQEVPAQFARRAARALAHVGDLGEHQPPGAHVEQPPGIGVADGVPQRAVRARFRVVKRHRADARRAVARPHADFIPAVRQNGRDARHAARVLAQVGDLERMSLRPRGKLDQMLRRGDLLPVHGQQHVAGADAGAARRAAARDVRHAHDQHALGRHGDADRLSAGDQRHGVAHVDADAADIDQSEQADRHIGLARAERRQRVLLGRYQRFVLRGQNRRAQRDFLRLPDAQPIHARQFAHRRRRGRERHPQRHDRRRRPRHASRAAYTFRQKNAPFPQACFHHAWFGETLSGKKQGEMAADAIPWRR